MASKPAADHSQTLARTDSQDHPEKRTKKRNLEPSKIPDTTDVEPSPKRRASTSQSDTMPRSISPSGANLTKTGRVSKANKGQPVHHCHCGKTYTRAEHLRRHQQNHKPGAFPCDIQGCDRAFYREDLLTRHKAKHNEHSNSSTSIHSRSTTDAPVPLQDSSVFQVTAEIANITDSESQSETGTRKGCPPVAEHQHPAIGLIAEDTQFTSLHQPALFGNSSPFPALESGYITPEPVYGLYDHLPGPLHVNTDYLWTHSSSSLGASHSPASVNSTAPMPFWRGSSPSYAQLHTPNSESSICHSRNGADLMSSVSFGDLTHPEASVSPEYRDMLERDELVTPTSAPQAASFGPNQYHYNMDNEQRYLDAFWSSTHPAWPVVHKPSFDVTYASPLLLSAMVTLGAYSTGNQIDAANACIVNKRCLNVLRKRTVSGWHSYRLCDMQAVLLVELFSISRSRRPPLQMSEAFVNSYRSLATEHVADTTDLLFATLDSVGSFSDPAVSTISFDHEARQRLLTAYYILDQQHATFFGRQESDIPEFVPGNVNLPQPLSLWDADLSHEIGANFMNRGYFAARVLLHQAVAAELRINEPPRESYDLFTSMLLIAYFSGDQEPAISEGGIEASVSKTPETEIAWHTIQLCNNTPIRALLAVAGESWVMAEKLSLRTDYTAAQDTVRRWTVVKAKKALPHARHLMRLHRAHPNSTSLFHEWSLHLASLVLWAHAYASRDQVGNLRLSIPPSNNAQTVVSVHEVDVALGRLAQVGTEGRILWQDVRCVLLWAKARIEKIGATRFCGLTSGAVDVLNTIMARGEDHGWF